MRDQAGRFQTSSEIGAGLTCGFGTAVAMWMIGYALRLPSVEAPGAVVLAALLAVLIVGGHLTARTTRRPGATSFLAGMTAMLVNLLILGGLLAEGGTDGISRRAVIWVPGSLLLGGITAWFGSWTTRGVQPRLSSSTTWNARFARVAVAATVGLMLIGGLVTSHEAGLAVPDWPRTFGSNMFLYPLSRMTGGIYYEHAHRLFGALVGLTTLTLAIRLLLSESRRAVKLLGLAALVLVSTQGLMGGMRVTEKSTALAISHGIVAQLFLALLVVIATICGERWQAAPPVPGSALARRVLLQTRVLFGALFVQLVLGAIVRQTGRWVLIHILGAALVTTLAFRLVGTVKAKLPHPVIGPWAGASSFLISLQLVLGFAAWLASAGRAKLETPSTADLWLTTLHQTNGALLLAAVAFGTVWVHRVCPVGQPDSALPRPA